MFPSIDPYIRDNKGYAGADKGWYFPLRNRSKIGPSLPLGSIVLCLTQPRHGQGPTLLNFMETKEVLKMFGSLLHHMCSENDYSDNTGNHHLELDARDFVNLFIAELIYFPDVLKLLSSHWMSKEELNEEIIKKLCTSVKHHMSGYHLCEELVSFIKSFARKRMMPVKYHSRFFIYYDIHV